MNETALKKETKETGALLKKILDRHAIEDLATRMFVLTDNREWKALRIALLPGFWWTTHPFLEESPQRSQERISSGHGRGCWKASRLPSILQRIISLIFEAMRQL